MLGIPTSMFNEAGGLVKDWLRNPLNAGFLRWYFLPAVVLVLLQLFIIGPMLGHPWPRILDVDSLKGEQAMRVARDGVIVLIVLPLMFGVILSSMSGIVLRFFQGTLPITRPFFQPFLKQNQKQCAEIYGTLMNKRREYLYLVSVGVRLVKVNGEERAEPVAESERELLVQEMKGEIQALHEQFESGPRDYVERAGPSDLANSLAGDGRRIPINPHNVRATRLANILAVAEDYPFEHYGMDASVFWPRLCDEIEPEKLNSLTTSFGAMKGLLNVSLLGYLFAIESLVIGLGVATGSITTVGVPLIPLSWLVAIFAVGIVVGIAAYLSAIQAARSVANGMRTGFDYYRGRILSRFNLTMPNDIEQERVVWLKLAAFIRRGESFYYPSEYRK